MSNLLNNSDVPDIVIGEPKSFSDNMVTMFASQSNTGATEGGTPSQAQLLLQSLWQRQMLEVQNMTSSSFKIQELPLARIKKIMKMDEEVKMISAEAPFLFAKAAQMFITELSLRAWIYTDESKRRTLQRNDIATAITKYDQFDFLIDIVPREELKPSRSAENSQVQYFYTATPQQPSQVRTTSGAQVTGTAVPASAIVLAHTGGQLVQLGTAGQLISQEANQQVPEVSQVQQQTSTAAAINTDDLQRFISNAGLTAGDIQSIQVTPDGQIQIIKTSAAASDSLQLQGSSSASVEHSQNPEDQSAILRLSSAISAGNSPSLVDISRLQSVETNTADETRKSIVYVERSNEE